MTGGFKERWNWNLKDDSNSLKNWNGLSKKHFWDSMYYANQNSSMGTCWANYSSENIEKYIGKL